MKKLYLIDISSFIFRAYYAIRPLTTKEGTPVNAVFGVVSMLTKLIDTHKPDHLIVCQDRPEKGFRHELFPAYKANRSAPPEDLVPQFDIIKEFIQTYPFKALDHIGYEADDIIATLVERFKKEPEIEIYIVSSDKDLMQLVDENVFLYDTMKEKVFKKEDVALKFGVGPEQVIAVQSLCGDPTDNIPGVSGVGLKTAAKLINQYGSLEAVLESATQIKGKLGEKITAGRDAALISRKLVTLDTHVPLHIEWADLKITQADQKALNAFYANLDFKRFIMGEVVPEEKKQEITKAAFITIKNREHLEEIVNNIIEAKPKYLSLDTETTTLDAHTTTLVGMSFCYEHENAYYIPIAHKDAENLCLQDVQAVFCPLLINEKIPKVGQNIKFDLNVLKQNNIDVSPVLHDTLVASYLSDPEGQHNLDFLADKYFGITTIKFKDLVGKEQTFAEVPIEKASEYAAEDAWVAFLLVAPLMKELEEQNLLSIYHEIEMPLVGILAAMEQKGVLVNDAFLEELDVEFSSRLKIYEQEIYELAGEEFNINSPKQLSVILFEKMGLSTVKKTKTGYSTDVEVLTELAREHALPKTLLAYRTLTKLLSTYVIGLKKLINNETKRVHSHFNQTIVATGRLSSTEPNLQNIPIKTDEGKRIRSLFMAPAEHVLLSADYSQIELRLLAAFSQDPKLISAYEKNEDIHARTAAHIFGLALEAVDTTQRSIGKTINFGVIYGQSAYGLAKQLLVPNKEAKRFIDGFYSEFTGVKEYKERILAEAREKGYVTTYLGRKRFLRDINSQNHLARQNAERMAFNAVFQGSAADLIKKAMIAIQSRLEQDHLKTKMILQVHDELLFEVPQDELSTVRSFIVDLMETTFTLSIPLKVTCHEGKTWAEAH